MISQDITDSVACRERSVVVRPVFCPKGAVHLARRNQPALLKVQHRSQNLHAAMLKERSYRTLVRCRTATVVHAMDTEALWDPSDACRGREPGPVAVRAQAHQECLCLVVFVLAHDQRPDAFVSACLPQCFVSPFTCL